MVVNDDSYNKDDPTSDYEIAKIEAEENAKQLAEELDISIAFFDWINVVRPEGEEVARACVCVYLGTITCDHRAHSRAAE